MFPLMGLMETVVVIFFGCDFVCFNFLGDGVKELCFVVL